MKKVILFLVCLLLLIGCSYETAKTSKQNWEESATFVRKSGFVFRIGDNGRFGFGEYGPFIAGETQKYMWHFWGDADTLTKPFKVIGVSKETSEKITVLQKQNNMNTLAPNNGADHHLPSYMELPNPGLWKLEVYFGDELFGNIIVNVIEK
ncbi:DUF4871 domain-containing protein [Salinibacillus xinjiangensis]|uniref:DUF4871 domain-containing protein n=1 Tax=Salinibacillus xinjiangensis TaxID=1229268 RepID=A0A6G1X6M6_9BACI|nr:DUF4871 domain-containing protein [Salinibacillus xinjiangensis]MRG86597.1 DUF4871 domain-containing protein [Salinibacillus xinjiangensis]